MFSKKIISNSYGIPRLFFYLGLLTIGQTIFRPALSFTLSDWFFLISLFFTTLESLMRRNLELRFPPYLVFGLFLFTIGGIISSGFSKMPLMSVIALIKYLYLIIVWFWLGTTLLRTAAQIQTAIALWASSAAISGFGALIQFIWGDVIPGSSPSLGRMTGLTEHVNELGGLTSIALIPALTILTRFSKNVFRLVHSWICTILITIGLLLSVSMSGVSALVASLLVWLVLTRFTLKKIIIICLTAALSLTTISFQSRYEGISILSRLSDVSDNGLSYSTLQTRLDTYSEAWEVISDNPLLGVGIGPDASMTKTGFSVHNILLLNWFQSGFFGFAGTLIILGSIALEAYKKMKDPKRKREQILGIALFSSYIAFIVLGMTQPIFYNRFGWISAALLLALNSSHHRFDERPSPYVELNQQIIVRSFKRQFFVLNNMGSRILKSPQK